MLYAPTSEAKTETAQSKSPFAPQPERELHPHAFGAAGLYSFTGAASAASVSPQIQHRHTLNGMQSTYGNQAVLRMVHSPQQVARMPMLRPSQSIMLQRKCTCGATSETEGECAECKEKREGALQRSVGNQVAPPVASTVPLIVHNVLSSPGQPLDTGTRAFMEPRFGHDFSQVRVHTDAKAAESARAVNALAYTVGRNVVFGTGQYAPGKNEGRRLMAHELTHVVQQGKSATLSTIVSRAMDDDQTLEIDQGEEMVGPTNANPGQEQFDTTARLNALIAQIEEGYSQAQQLIASTQSTDEDQKQLETISERLSRLRAIADSDDEQIKLSMLNLFSSQGLEQAQAQLVAARQEGPAVQPPEGLAAKALYVSNPQDSTEVEADRVAEGIVSNSHISVETMARGDTINRQPAPAIPPPVVQPFPPPVLVPPPVPVPPPAPIPWWLEAAGAVAAALLVILTFGAVLESDTPIPKTKTRYANQTCEDSTLDTLQQNMHNICDNIPGESCSPSKVSPKRLDRRPCSEIRLRILAMEACLQARQKIQVECFANGPDQSDPESVKQFKIHQDAIDQVKNGIASCLALAAVNCAPGHPMANL